MPRIHKATEESSAQSAREAASGPRAGGSGRRPSRSEAAAREAADVLCSRLCSDCSEKAMPFHLEGDVFGVLSFRGYCQRCKRIAAKTVKKLLHEVGLGDG